MTVSKLTFQDPSNYMSRLQTYISVGAKGHREADKAQRADEKMIQELSYDKDNMEAKIVNRYPSRGPCSHGRESREGTNKEGDR